MRTRQQLAQVRALDIFNYPITCHVYAGVFPFNVLLKVNAQLQILSREQRRADLTFQGEAAFVFTFVVVLP